jgi:glucosamine-6-phosphate deaminase
VVDLTPQTIAANAKYWGSTAPMPTRAVTMGLSSLLAARTVVLLVSGPHKKKILHEALEGPITSEVPASYLQTIESVVVVSDQQAWGRT